MIAILWFVVPAACDVPQDPRETLERVRGDTLIVGVVEQRPWVVRFGDDPAGVEPALVRAFARELDAEVTWVWGTTQTLFEALVRYELDLVVGGVTESTPWRGTIGLTRPYYEEVFTVGVPPALEPPRDLDGLPVAVEKGSMLIARVEAHDAVPVRVADLEQAEGLVAAPVWQVSAWGLHPSGIVLHRARHVMAVPPGENGWLLRLERYLDGISRDEVEFLLEREVQP